MALLDFECFGEETNGNYSGWWTEPRANTISAEGSGPFGIGRYMQPSTFQISRTNSFANTGTLLVNAHVWNASGLSSLMAVYDGTTIQANLAISATGVISVQRNGSTTLASTTETFPLNAWLFVQVRYVIANAGSFEVWVDGRSVLSGSGDTQQTANAYANGWGCGIGGGRYTNFVIYSETGNAPNARTPETVCYSDIPNGAGASSAWTPSAGSNYQNVDEAPADNDTTYNSAASAPLDDLYAYPSPVPASAVVYAVACECDARRDDAGTNTVDLLCRAGGTTQASGTPYNLTSSYTRFKRVWDLDPSTGLPWSTANANGSQVGIRRTV